MTGRDGSLAVAAFVGVIVAAAALAPAMTAGRVAFQIPVTDATGTDEALGQPNAAAWQDVESVTIPLSSAPSSVPDAGDTSVEEITVEAAYTADRLYLRLSWNDTTRDDTIDTPRTFVDAAAVQFPTNVTTRPAIAMGSPRTPVNVWYWNAEEGGEELLAGGPGTTTRFEDPAVGSTTTYRDGRWRLVFNRSLDIASTQRTPIRTDQDLDVALAVWNGSNMERSGRKSVSQWYTLTMGPGPQGPPYQAILWTIAGLAIVAVIIVTVIAVRRN